MWAESILQFQHIFITGFLVKAPGDSVDAADGKVSSKIDERSGGEIQVELGTPGASINNLYSDGISVD